MHVLVLPALVLVRYVVRDGEIRPVVVNRPQLQRPVVGHHGVDAHCVMCARELVPVSTFQQEVRKA
ncbi:hypothetical protein SDC9_104920 [bioreactor metagenome]|uniref:Uncharacterized protein n=1 Tax=bioreactor metagenome TaxID=1076179 RepID=A0A645B0L4_9ZZZZ